MDITFEDLVTKLNEANSPFDLAGDMSVFKQGMTDLLDRLQALEKSTRTGIRQPK